MRNFGPSSHPLAGSLLIAHPGLRDPNFHRTVLYLSTHDPEEGSFGAILNRPAERVVAEILPGRKFGALGRVPVFLGGPVAVDELVFASFQWQAEVERFECRHHLQIEEAEEALEDGETLLRAFIGYAGWSKGQLERELTEHSWLVLPAAQDALELGRSPVLWRELTSSFGPWFQLAAEAPEDISQN